MADKEMLVVGSKVKDYIKSKGLMTGGDLLEAVNSCVHCCLDAACRRAEANGRKTLRGCDC